MAILFEQNYLTNLDKRPIWLQLRHTRERGAITVTNERIVSQCFLLSRSFIDFYRSWCGRKPTVKIWKCIKYINPKAKAFLLVPILAYFTQVVENFGFSSKWGVIIKGKWRFLGNLYRKMSKFYDFEQKIVKWGGVIINGIWCRINGFSENNPPPCWLIHGFCKKNLSTFFPYDYDMLPADSILWGDPSWFFRQ